MNELYGDQTKLTLQNMSFSGVRLAEFPTYIFALAEVKKACALANYRSHLLSQEKMEAICAACDALMQNDYTAHFPVDVFHGGGGIGINMNINEVLAALAGHGVHPVDDVNLSQSTSDACHTALRLSLYRQVHQLEEVVQAIIGTAEKKEKDFEGCQTIARTCWQDGMAVSAGAVFAGFSEALTEQLGLLKAYEGTLLKINLGWTVIGSGTGAADQYREQIIPALREVTGLPVSWKHSAYQAAQFTDDLSVLSNFVRVLSSILAKFARDVRLLSSGPETGFDEWNIPAVQAGSSFFPGKINPVEAEMMIQCDFLIGGNDSVVQNVLSQGEVHLNVWEDMAGFLLMQNITRLMKAADLFHRRCICGIELNEAVNLEHAQASIPLIVKFKETYGYAKLAALVKQSGFERAVERIRSGELDQK